MHAKLVQIWNQWLYLIDPRRVRRGILLLANPRPERYNECELIFRDDAMGNEAWKITDH